jgi:hypothetical protein
MGLRFASALVIAAAFAAMPPRLEAQAFTAPEGIGSITIAWQVIDNTGHRFTDGFLLAAGQSKSVSLLAELDYGVTDRLSATVGIPFVFAKYTGALPPPSRLPVDACQCWHSGFQDFSLAARYRFGRAAWGITPHIRYVRPSHDYPYEGEAVVGRNLREIQVGLTAGLRLEDLLPRASVQAGYTYSFVERPLAEISIDRSNGFLDFGYALSQRLFARAAGAWQRTHGGLLVGSPTGNPFPLPGQLNTPVRFAQRDRLISTQYWQAGGGVSYSVGDLDLFFSVMKYVWGRNAHNGQLYTLGSTWHFDLSK